MKAVTTPARPVTYLTTTELARYADCAPRMVAKWCDGGMLRCVRLPGSTHRRIPADAAAAFLGAHGYAVPDALANAAVEMAKAVTT